MDKKGFSRRRFLRNVAASSTGAALASLPAAARAATPEAPWPVTVESYPLASPGQGESTARVKLVTKHKFKPGYEEKVHACAPNVDLVVCEDPDKFRREVADAHIIFGHFTPDDFQAARQLRWVQFNETGVEKTLYPEFVNSPVVLTNMQRMASPTISETAIGLMLTLARGLNRYALLTHDHVWKGLDGLQQISGLTLGMVGMGGIGSDTAYRAHYGFNMKVLGVDPKPLPRPDFVAELHALDWLPKMVPQVDILMSAAPHTPLSQGMFNEAIFRAMKPTAFFINVSRGPLVNTPDLIRALKEGWIAGAGLDVTYIEPLPPDDPLWTAGNLIITSHSSAASDGYIERFYGLLGENLRRYVNGLPLLNVVDKKRGY